MRILTRDEIRAVENRAFDGLFTEAQLMERAGWRVPIKCWLCTATK